MAGFQTSIHQYGNGNSSGGNDPYNFNPRYPGLDEANYRKLSMKIDALGLTGYERENAMDNAYRQILPIIEKDRQNSERNKILNQASYDVSQIQNPNDRKLAQGKLTVEQLTQQVKETYDLDPTADDQAVFNHWIQGIPNGKQLLIDYLNDGNRELLYAGGLEQKVEAPQTTQGSVGGLTSVMNEQAKQIGDTKLGKVNGFLDWINLIGKATEGVDNLAQKIPIVTFDGKVQNLANKINNLTEDDMQRLYNRYTNMIQNARKGDTQDRGRAELMWDGLIEGDQQAIDMLNTLQLADYSEALQQDGIERNQRGSQALEKATGSDNVDLQGVYENIDNSNMWKPVKALAKGAAWTTDKMKNLINFIGGSYGALENYAESAAVGMQKLDDVKNRRWTIPQNMETDENAFEAFVADKTANFGEYLVDAPNTIVGVNGGPNMAKFLANIPGSFVKSITAKVRAKTNPLDTKMGLLRMLFTEEGQQALINRYGTVDNLQRSMEQDPVGLASDIIDRGDKINRAFNKASGGLVERQDIRDVTDIMSDNLVKGNVNLRNDKVLRGVDTQIPGIVQGLNNVSNWLSNKGYSGLGNLVTFENRVSQTDPGQLLQDPNKFMNELGQTARIGLDTFKGTWGDTQDFFLERANRKIQNINRMTKKQQEKFHDMTGEDQGEFMNKRGYKTLDDMADALTKNLEQVDGAMDTIEGRFRSKILDDVVDDVVKYASDTEDPKLQRLQELYNKNKEGGLEMKEINEIKRYYERTNIFDYLKANNSKKARKSTNRDSKLREWQYETAKKSGLDNLPELNKETQALKFLVDNTSGWQKGIKGNNDITLTDWIVAAGGGLSPESIASLVGKQVYQSSWFQNKLVDVYNYLGGRETEAGPTVDFEKIKQANIDRALMAAELAKVKTKEELDAWFKRAELLNPALPHNPEYDNQAPIDYSSPTRVTPEGTATRYGQIGEENTTTPNYRVENGELSQNDIYSKNEMDNIESDLDSNTRPMDEQIKLGWGDEYYEDTDSISVSEQSNIRAKFDSEYPDMRGRLEDVSLVDGFNLKNNLTNILGQEEAGDFLRSYFENPTGSINTSKNIEEIATPREGYNMVENLRGLSRDELAEAVKVMNRTMPVGEIEQTLLDDLNMSIDETNSILREVGIRGTYDNEIINRVKEMNKTMPAGEIERWLLEDEGYSIDETNRILKDAIDVVGTYAQRQAQTNEIPLNEEESYPITNIRKIESYVPDEGEGNTRAEQLATAVNKLVYRYYNDGDRYDEDYANEVANYANWIERHAFELPEAVLTRGEYEENLQTIVDRANELIEEWKEMPKIGSIYSDSRGKWTYEDEEPGAYTR